MFADSARPRPGQRLQPVAGYYLDPVYGKTVTLTVRATSGPGYYSRDPRGLRRRSPTPPVMDGLRAGRIWVDHGGLLDGLDVTGAQVGRRRARRHPGRHRSPSAAAPAVDLSIVRSTSPSAPNWAQFVPKAGPGGRRRGVT